MVLVEGCKSPLGPAQTYTQLRSEILSSARRLSPREGRIGGKYSKDVEKLSLREAATSVLYAIYCAFGVANAPSWVLDIAYGTVDFVAED